MEEGTTASVDHSLSPCPGADARSLSDLQHSAQASASGIDFRSRMAEYLQGLPESERSAALRLLLSLDLQYRLQAGEHPRPEEYDLLFPNAAPFVRSVFQEAGLPSAQPLDPSTATRHPPKSQPANDSVDSDKCTDPWAGARARAGTWGTGSGSAADSLLNVPGYEILEVLGKGGMGVVYKARHLKLQRVVALKMILSRHPYSLSQRKRDLFLAEARVVAQFQHPHLVQIHEIGEFNGQPYFSLELLAGGNLSEKLAGTPQPAAAAAALLETVARAVDYAHQKGIVHRDLKPSNILLAADGTPKVADFGVAKQLEAETAPTDEAGIVGTPSYMSPEQAWGNNSEVGPPADIYSLGTILYEMLTGRPPFKTIDKWQTLLLVRDEDPVSPRQLVPQVPRDLELICLKCLRKDRAQRFASALELADELRRFQEGRPILTRPVPHWERVWKWSLRQPAVASLIAVSVVALLSLVLYLDQRARVARRELHAQQRTAGMRDQVQNLHLKAQEAADRELLSDARGALQAAFEILSAEPSLNDLKPGLTSLQTEVARKEAELEDRRLAEAALKQFFGLRDTALFHGMVFEGVDLPANVTKTSQACQKALALFEVSVVPPRGPVFPRHFSAEQKQKCTLACYELLLVWAEATVQPRAGRKSSEQSQLAEALGLLDRAARLDAPSTRAYHQRRASYLELRGDVAEARRERQRAAMTRPQQALDHFLNGSLYQKRGQLDEAAKAFARALRIESDHFWARYFLGVCNLQQLRPAQARDNFTACLMSRGDFLWLYLLRGFANGQLNDFRAAEDDFRRAGNLEPDPQARYGILVNQGELCLRQARQVESLIGLPWPVPLAPPVLVACQGVARAYRDHRLAAGAAFLQQAIELQPDPFPAYHYLAMVRQQQKQRDRAVEVLGKAIAAAPERSPRLRAQLFGQRARIYREQGNTTAALEDLDRAIQLFPRAEDHAERGRMLHLDHKYRPALTAYDAALGLREAWPDVWRWKAQALMALHRDSDAADALDQYLAKGGVPTAEVYRDRGRIRAQLRRFPAALADYTQALALQATSATHTARGWVFLANEVQPLARQDFEEAIRLDATNAEAYTGRGLIRARLGDVALALADAEAALRQDRPRTPRLLWNTAHVYAQLAGQPDQRVRARLTRKKCVERAVALLKEALERLPAKEREGFWQKSIAQDGLLNPLRGEAGFERLRERYGK